MAATLTSVAPLTGNPGDQITLTGTGFAAGAAVAFVGGGQSLSDSCAVVVSATQITATVPDFGGDALTLAIAVQNDGEDPTASANFSLKQYPPVVGIYPLCGLNAVKRALSIDADDHNFDDSLRKLILIASAQMSMKITLDLQPVELTGELYDGDETQTLYLRRQPVSAVSAVSIWGTAIDMSEIKIYPDSIAFDDSCGFWNPRIQAISRIFPRGRQNISVSYTAGFTNLPVDIPEACTQQAIFLRNLESKQGLISDANSQTAATTQYSQLPLAPFTQQVCNRYKKMQVRAA